LRGQPSQRLIFSRISPRRIGSAGYWHGRQANSYLSPILVNAVIVNTISQQCGNEPEPTRSNGLAELRRDIPSLLEVLALARTAATDR